MSRQYKIKWKSSDNEELAKAVRNFNAKITRLAKKNPKLANVLPDKTSVRELKKLINTRKDLKRELNSLRRFSKRGQEEIIELPGNDYNLQITKWQKREMSIRAMVVNRRRSERLKELEELQAKSRGKPLGYTLGNIGMGSVEANTLKPTNAFTPSMTRTSLKMKWKSLLSESQSDYFINRDSMCRENYLKGLKENYNWEDIKDIYHHIEKMDLKEFMRTFYEEGATFEFASPDGRLNHKYQEYLAYENELREIWLPGSESPNLRNSVGSDFLKKTDELDKLRTPKTRK